MAAEEQIPGWGQRLQERVSNMQDAHAEFRQDQADKWGANSGTHKDLYAKLDRLPAWATLLLSLITGVAGAGWGLFLAG